MSAASFQPGSIVTARGREWVVLPQSQGEVLHLRPMGAGERDASVVYLPLEPEPVTQASFPLPDPERAGTRAEAELLRDALMLKLRSGAGPFRSFGNIAFEPRAYQLVPLLMALKQETIRLLIADDVGIGKTIEAGLIVRELMDRGEVERFTVLCPPHLCEQWQQELAARFHLHAEIVRTSTAARLERNLPPGVAIFEAYPFTVVSLDYIKSDRRRDEFYRSCPGCVIVDEAHTCTQGAARSRHQRYRLLKGLSEGTERHLILLTATPHSGDEDAFYNLLGLLDPEFQALKDLSRDAREPLRQRLGDHLCQRRRPDIAEWQEASLFPARYSAEATYRLTGAWGLLFDEVLDYARALVEVGEQAGRLQERIAIDFHLPARSGSQFVHRTHPLVSLLADHVLETTLEDGEDAAAARSAAFFARGQETLTVVWLLRVRTQLTVARRERERILLAEEAVTLVERGDELAAATPEETAELLALEPAANMADGLRVRHVRRALDRLNDLSPRFEAEARRRAEALLEDHRRVRRAAEATGRYRVAPVLPVDVIGVYVLVPYQGEG